MRPGVPTACWWWRANILGGAYCILYFICILYFFIAYRLPRLSKVEISTFGKNSQRICVWCNHSCHGAMIQHKKLQFPKNGFAPGNLEVVLQRKRTKNISDPTNNIHNYKGFKNLSIFSMVCHVSWIHRFSIFCLGQKQKHPSHHAKPKQCTCLILGFKRMGPQEFRFTKAGFFLAFWFSKKWIHVDISWYSKSGSEKSKWVDPLKAK